MNAYYDTTQEQYEQFYGEYDESWILVRKRVVENMFEIREQTTADEWHDLVKQFSSMSSGGLRSNMEWNNRKTGKKKLRSWK